MIKKDYFNVSQAVISEDNIQRIGELISLKALKMLCQFSQKAFDRIDNTPEKADGFLFDCGKRHIVCTAEFCVCFR